LSNESFSDIEGGFTIRASRDAWEIVRKDIFEVFQGEDISINKGRVVDTAIAVGIAEENMMEPSGSDPYRTSTDSVDPYHVLKTLIEVRHPEKNADDLQDAMIEYFEGGLQVISNEIEENGYFDYERYLPEDVPEAEIYMH